METNTRANPRPNSKYLCCYIYPAYHKLYRPIPRRNICNFNWRLQFWSSFWWFSHSLHPMGQRPLWYRQQPRHQPYTNISNRSTNHYCNRCLLYCSSHPIVWLLWKQRSSTWTSLTRTITTSTMSLEFQDQLTIIIIIIMLPITIMRMLAWMYNIFIPEFPFPSNQCTSIASHKDRAYLILLGICMELQKIIKIIFERSNMSLIHTVHPFVI